MNVVASGILKEFKENVKLIFLQENRFHMAASVLIVHLPCNLCMFIINVLLDELSIGSFRLLNLFGIIRMYFQKNHLKRSLFDLRTFQVYALGAR